MTPEDGPMPDPIRARLTRAQAFALFLIVFTDMYGLTLVALTPILVILGQSAGDAIAFGVCGLGLITWARRR